MTPTLEIVKGDITEQGDIDVIVNAANCELRSGSGVCGAIMRAGGWAIEQECRVIGPCETGSARLTCAGDLPNKHVAHAVGPIYARYDPPEAKKLLADAHRSAVEAAAEASCDSIAFPALSCGIYGYPIADAAPVAISAAMQAAQESGIDLVRFVLFCDEDLAVFEAAAQ